MLLRRAMRTDRRNPRAWARWVLALLAILASPATPEPSTLDPSSAESAETLDFGPLEFCRIRLESPSDWAETVVDLGPAFLNQDTASVPSPEIASGSPEGMAQSVHTPTLHRRARAPGTSSCPLSA